MASHIISVSDLSLVTGWNAAFAKQDLEAVKKILYENGFDTTKEITFEPATHRNLRNQVVDGLRVVGTELTEDWWLKSGAASEQVKLEQLEGSMFKELANMSRRGITSAECEYDSKDYNVRNINDRI